MTTTGDSELTAASPFVDADCSTLITVSTPDCDTPICRLGNAKEILGNLTVRQLIERVVSPNSLLSVHVPMTQLEAETPTAAAISELLATGCEVVLEDDPNGNMPVPLDAPAASITEAQVGAQGSSFLNISLEVRASNGGVALADERRQMAVPEVVEVETPQAPAADLSTPPAEERRQAAVPEVVEAALEPAASPDEVAPVDDLAQPISIEKIEELFADEKVELTAPAPASSSIVAIVAERPPRQPRITSESAARKEYIRKSDWLRAQFLPEVQALDFSGLFVGNLGLGVREEQARRNVVLADPARITEILLRGNSYRRTGDYAKALICYQELVDMDPGNADFRFLLGKTLLELGQHEQGVDALNRARELGHEGARKELETVKAAAPKARNPLGVLRFWKQ